MAIKRKIDNETEDQKSDRLHKEVVSNYATRSEKTSWSRKRNNLEKVINKTIRPVEERILDLHNELRPAYDKVSAMREEMVESCVHPYDLLIIVGDTVHCKFCQRTLAKPNED